MTKAELLKLLEPFADDAELLFLHDDDDLGGPKLYPDWKRGEDMGPDNDFTRCIFDFDG